MNKGKGRARHGLFSFAENLSTLCRFVDNFQGVKAIIRGELRTFVA